MNIAVITGASSGIGREFARRLDSVGVDELWILARRKKRLEQLAADLKTPARVLVVDLNVPREIDGIEKLLKRYNPTIKWLINNAGFGKIGDFASISRAAQLSMIDVNVRALTHITHLAIPYMSRGTRIVQVASAAGYQPLGGFAVYSATKAYVISFAYALGAELRERGISMTVMAPGPVHTEFSLVSRDNPAWRKAMLSHEAEVGAVVDRALRDAHKQRRASIYGLSKFAPLLARLLPRRLTAIVSQRFIYTKVRPQS
ncbi:MAG: SDR family NAD(P)-dependent oxidoreductase [Chitinivibrionales bacterium]|nr:SDR family NAD(P)-dependent oxidoreductase [Chitinivibrionales bacterium]MBD3356692.1 SDR family NAD(P)-dependent oxidoreductase [Chitinivibrionales bacterium]